MQVQYSLLDAAAGEQGLPRSAGQHGISLLCYGSVAGGFLSDRWLGQAGARAAFENRSLTKYKLIIDDFGGWELFQELLRSAAADRRPPRHRHRHRRQRAMLDRPRSPPSSSAPATSAHLAANAGIIGLSRSRADDRAEIAAVLAERKGPEGDTFALERDRTGRHGSIMKYNLNAGRS